MTESFPRQRARTRNFTIGVPRAFGVAPDGERVTFLRTRSGDDPVTCLWELNVSTGEERVLADPRQLGADDENLPPEERARRERVRETGSGIVSYSVDSKHTLAVFPLSGQVYAVPLGGSTPDGKAGDGPRIIETRTPALDPRPDPTGTRVGYVSDGAFRVIDLESGKDTVVAEPNVENGETVTFGLAEFVAAEEMGRFHGYWWSPDGTRVLLTRVDESPVNAWHIADPANPDREPTSWKYPAAGTPNAEVRLFIAEIDGADSGAGTSTRISLAEVDWDHDAFPYVVTASWGERLLIVTQSRDQKTMRLADGLTGEVYVTDTDAHWTDVIDGAPAQLPDGEIVWTRVTDDTRRLVVASAADLSDSEGGGAEPVTPPGLHVRGISGTDGNTVYFTASREPTEIGVWRYGPDGLEEFAAGPGVHAARAGGGTTVTVGRALGSSLQSVRIKNGLKDVTVGSFAEEPNLPQPSPRFLEAGPDGIRTAVLFPSWHKPGDGKLPVLMDPYGGPHAQRVLKTSSIFLQSQWFAEQGFAVVVADGRGTPGRGIAWDRAVAGDLATPVLEDQVTALHAAAAEFADLDLEHVGIRGWSFGGYLAALAVLRRPDVFHAAIAGAPVTDWRLYDTHYTERYLGDPGQDGAAYARSSLLDDPMRITAADQRPLLLIHGLADDNVLVAHTLRLSNALLAAGYPHSVLPLSGVTHMTPQEAVAENLLLLQVDFLRSSV